MSDRSKYVFRVIVALIFLVGLPLGICVARKSLSLPTTVEYSDAADGEYGAHVVLDLDAVRSDIEGEKDRSIVVIRPHLVLSDARLLEPLYAQRPMLLDRILSSLRSHSADDLYTNEGVVGLKKDIMMRLNAEIEGTMSGSIIDIYFSEFFIQ